MSIFAEPIIGNKASFTATPNVTVELQRSTSTLLSPDRFFGSGGFQTT